MTTDKTTGASYQGLLPGFRKGSFIGGYHEVG